MDAPLHNGIKRVKVVVSASHFTDSKRPGDATRVERHHGVAATAKLTNAVPARTLRRCYYRPSGKRIKQLLRFRQRSLGKAILQRVPLAVS